MKNNPVKSAGPITAALSGLLPGHRNDRTRLEAFLSAVPGEYCGFAADGSAVYSEGFCRLLGLSSLRALQDIQSNLNPSDAAALESLFTRLHETGENFAISVEIAGTGRVLRLSGTRGRDSSGKHHYDILWLEDISAQVREYRQTEKEKDSAAGERDRLQTSLDALPQPLWMRNSRTELIWCNRAYATALGITQAAVIADQKELSSKTAPRKGAKAPGKTLAQAALDSGQPESTQAHVVIGGNRRLMQIQEISIPALHITLGSARDISREEELETELKRNASANKELLEQLGSAIAIFDGSQRIEFYNSAFSQLWALEDQYLNNKPKLGDIMEKLREHRRLPEQVDFRRFKDSWLGMFTSLIGPHEEMLYLPNDTAVRMLAVPHPMGGLMITFEDVTSRLELESSYNTLIAVQRETLDNLAEGVAVYGGDGKLKLWNPSFARLWNLSHAEMDNEPHISKLADKMKERFAPETQEENKKALTAQAISRRLAEGQMKRGDGTLIAFTTVPLPDGGVLVTHVDVTDKTRVENALREKNAALEAAERLKLDFLANVSYQLRTPLNAIMGFAEILGNEYFGKLTDRQKEYSSGISEAGQRLVSLVDDILDLSTIEAGYMELGHDKVDISTMLQALQDLTTDWARKEGITVTMKCPKNIGTIAADERRLKQVLLNLIRNAISFTPHGGTITVSAKRHDDKLDLVVSDTGAGIPAEDQARIFEPFERAGNRPGRGGAGLGLALVRNIVELHKGTIGLESAENKGTTVTITLPGG